MRKFTCLLCVFLLLGSCRQNEVKIEDKPVMVEISSEEDSIIDTNIEFKNLDDFLQNYDKLNIKPEKQIVGELFKIDGASVFYESETKDVYLIIKLTEEIKTSVIGNYKIIARIYPEYKEQVRKENLDRNIEFDSWYITPKQVVVGDDYFITVKLTNGVKNYKKLILQQINLNSSEISPVKVIITDGLDYF